MQVLSATMIHYDAYLLPEAYTRARVEWDEDGRVGREVLVEPLVEEAVRVKAVRCTFDQK